MNNTIADDDSLCLVVDREVEIGKRVEVKLGDFGSNNFTDRGLRVLDPSVEFVGGKVTCEETAVFEFGPSEERVDANRNAKTLSYFRIPPQSSFADAVQILMKDPYIAQRQSAAARFEVGMNSPRLGYIQIGFVLPKFVDVYFTSEELAAEVFGFGPLSLKAYDIFLTSAEHAELVKVRPSLSDAPTNDDGLHILKVYKLLEPHVPAGYMIDPGEKHLETEEGIIMLVEPEKARKQSTRLVATTRFELATDSDSGPQLLAGLRSLVNNANESLEAASRANSEEQVKEFESFPVVRGERPYVSLKTGYTNMRAEIETALGSGLELRRIVFSPNNVFGMEPVMLPVDTRKKGLRFVTRPLDDPAYASLDSFPRPHLGLYCPDAGGRFSVGGGRVSQISLLTVFFEQSHSGVEKSERRGGASSRPKRLGAYTFKKPARLFPNVGKDSLSLMLAEIGHDDYGMVIAGERYDGFSKKVYTDMRWQLRCLLEILPPGED